MSSNVISDQIFCACGFVKMYVVCCVVSNILLSCQDEQSRATFCFNISRQKQR